VATRDGVRDPRELASFGRRLAAYLLDVGVPYSVVLVVWAALGGPGGGTSNALGAVYMVAIVAYLLWSWTTQGSTVAMAAMGIRIEAENGGPVGLGPAVVRLIVLALLQLLALVALVAGIYLALSSLEPGSLSLVAVAVMLAVIFGGVGLLYAGLRGPRYWHDRLARTVVIRDSPARRGRSRR
jgi:uncharacterized RDD family membrane protein YckC